MGNNEDPKVEETTVQQKLILSDDFEQALSNGASVKSDIRGAMQQRMKNNYDRFYEMMLMANPEIESISSKRKRNRTPEECEKFKKFQKDVRKQYKIVKEMTFLPEDEKLNDDGTTNTIPKKCAQIIERLSLAIPLLEYIGNDTIVRELAKRGITVQSTPLEERSEAFQNERIKEDMADVFRESCAICGDIESAERRIKDEIFNTMVPDGLRYDNQSNPCGIRDSDFKKLVDAKYNLIKSENSESPVAKEKANEKIIDEAEKRSFDIERSKTLRLGFLSIGQGETETETSPTEKLGEDF